MKPISLSLLIAAVCLLSCKKNSYPPATVNNTDTTNSDTTTPADTTKGDSSSYTITTYYIGEMTEEEIVDNYRVWKYPDTFEVRTIPYYATVIITGFGQQVFSQSASNTYTAPTGNRTDVKYILKGDSLIATQNRFVGMGSYHHSFKGRKKD